MSILVISLLVPLFGAALVLALPKDKPDLARKAALGVSLVVLVLIIAMALQFSGTAQQPYDFVSSAPWIPSFGIAFKFGLDGIALVLVALSAILVPIVIIAGWHEADEAEIEGRGTVRGYYAWMLVLEFCMIGVFASLDVFMFYVFFEVMLIPMYFLIGRYGGAQRSYAAVKFLLYSLLGGLLMLAALIGLYVAAGKELGGQSTFDFQALSTISLDPGTQKLLFLGFFFAFAVKAPLVPFHTWLPTAAAEATPGSATLLVGVLDKVGTFGMLRFCLPLFPDASKYFAPAVIVLAVVGIIYGALLAIGQTDVKRLIAYTSISHFGFIVLGIFAFTTLGISGSSLYMVNHGFSTALLFLMAGFLISRRGSKLIESYGGISKVAPLMAGLFLFASLATIALPGLSTFISEFMVLLGTFQVNKVAAIIATFGIVLAAVYALWLYQRTMTGPVKEGCEDFPEMNGREVWAIAPMVAIVIALGVYPKPVLDVVNPAVEWTMNEVGATDPEPALPPLVKGTQQ